MRRWNLGRRIDNSCFREINGRSGAAGGQAEFNMPVKETVKSVNNNQLLRTYDTEDSFARRRDFAHAYRALFV